MQEGFILTGPISFERAMTRPIPSSAVATPLPKHRQRTPALPSIPRHSSQLAKKAMHRTPVAMVAQNVPMKKLSISSKGQLQSSGFERYMQMFKEGLSERQV
jgi:hypothetical protein